MCYGYSRVFSSLKFVCIISKLKKKKQLLSSYDLQQRAGVNMNHCFGHISAKGFFTELECSKYGKIINYIGSDQKKIIY